MVSVSTEATVTVNAFSAFRPAASATCAVKRNDPAAEGVPDNRPVAASSATPGGKEPALTDHRYGAAPPATCSVCEYCVPGLPAGRSGAVVMVSACATAKVNSLDAFCVAAS